ncbi:MAG: outer membrane beta-barrel protein [Burkholderiales bacterium]|nr:outer membrane beta-barrel protein [Burkholderiales bacterium]
MRRFLGSVVAVGCVFVCGTVVAAEGDSAAVPLGPIQAYPSVGLALKSDDNIFMSNANKKSSTIEVLSPIVKLVAQNRDDIYGLTYRADLGRYSSSSADNYNDQSLVGKADIVASTRAAFRLQPEYLLQHDPRGSTYGAGTAVPNRWREAGISGVFYYGSEGAKGRVEVAAGYHATKYLNNRNLTVAYDKKITDLGGTFFYRVMPKTSLLFEAKNSKIAYDLAGSTLNSNQRDLLVGAKWEATAKTTGDFRIGQVQKKYDSGTRSSFTGMGWNGLVQWDAKPYSRVTLDLSRMPVETTLAGSNFIWTTSSTADWAYDWNDRITSHLSYNQYSEDFKGLGLGTKTNNYGMGVDYRMRRWLKTSLNWANSVKTVNQAAYSNFNYDRNIVMLTLIGTL